MFFNFQLSFLTDTINHILPPSVNSCLKSFCIVVYVVVFVLWNRINLWFSRVWLWMRVKPKSTAPSLSFFDIFLNSQVSCSSSSFMSVESKWLKQHDRSLIRSTLSLSQLKTCMRVKILIGSHFGKKYMIR